VLCDVLGVPRSSYYHQLKRRQRLPNERERVNATLLAQIKAVFDKNKGRYGSPRVHAALKKQQVACSLGRVKRLMRREGLYAVSTPKYRPKRECPEVIETRNLLLQEGLEITAINQLWHVDITYIPTDEGWLYLAGVIDGFSKRVVGYAVAERMKTELVMQALRGAVQRRKPAPGLIHQSDRGGQYTSSLYQKELASRAMCASFTGKGACFDNAVIESFWATLKRELVYPRERFATRDEARTAIFEFIEIYYNRERLHSSLNYETPEAHERLQQPLEALAALAA
jgi:putative transposase